jgi:hypothetical protein
MVSSNKSVVSMYSFLQFTCYKLFLYTLVQAQYSRLCNIFGSFRYNDRLVT